MKAMPGDWVVVEGTHLNVPRRQGLIVEVHHPDGSPPYLVRWTDSGTETLFFPGPDTRVLSEAELAELAEHGRR